MDGSKALAEWMSIATSLAHLMLSNTGCELEPITSALTAGQGCTQLIELDISHNPMEKDSANALLAYLRKSGDSGLTRLDLTNTQLPIDSLKEIMILSRGSVIVKENNLSSFPGAQMINAAGSRINTLRMVDLTDNDLGDEGVALVATGLSHSTSVEHLVLNGMSLLITINAIRIAK
jgi:Ran GTPase-activating protein (RanGAP) involved in mRNA processing and transport